MRSYDSTEREASARSLYDEAVNLYEEARTYADTRVRPAPRLWDDLTDEEKGAWLVMGELRLRAAAVEGFEEHPAAGLSFPDWERLAREEFANGLALNADNPEWPRTWEDLTDADRDEFTALAESNELLTEEEYELTNPQASRSWEELSEDDRDFWRARTREDINRRAAAVLGRKQEQDVVDRLVAGFVGGAPADVLEAMDRNGGVRNVLVRSGVDLAIAADTNSRVLGYIADSLRFLADEIEAGRA